MRGLTKMMETRKEKKMKLKPMVPVDRKLEALACYAMRYALDRQSYAVEDVTHYLRALLPHVRETELYIWARDIERKFPPEEAELLRGREDDGYSETYFRGLWMGLLRDIREEEERRNKC